MDIISLAFENKIYININNQIIELVVFKTTEPGNIKFGIEAPRSIQVHREEIYNAIKKGAEATTC